MRNTAQSNVRTASASLVTARTALALSTALLAYCFAATLLPAAVIPGDTTIGTWDAENRVFTLTTDVGRRIEINESDLTLDGAGHTVVWGVYATGQSNLTIRNMIIEGIDYGGMSYRQIDLEVHASQRSSIVIENNEFRSRNDADGIRIKTPGVPVDTTIANNVILGTNQNYTGYFISTPRLGEHTVTGNTIRNLGPAGKAITVGSGPSVVADNTVSGCQAGIILAWGVYECTGNIISDSTWGLLMTDLEDSCVTDNTFSLNEYGILMGRVEGSRVYNNNFIDNVTQVYCAEDPCNCTYNLAKPAGGNYWSDWTSPDSDGDGIVDFPYVFDGGQDNLPWAVQDGWLPQTMIEQLVSGVLALNLQQGIENGLDAKLDAAQHALDDLNANNDGAAVNTLGAFISAVEAQRGNKIAEADADALIAAAQQIIDLLNAP